MTHARRSYVFDTSGAFGLTKYRVVSMVSLNYRSVHRSWPSPCFVCMRKSVLRQALRRGSTHTRPGIIIMATLYIVVLESLSFISLSIGFKSLEASSWPYTCCLWNQLRSLWSPTSAADSENPQLCMHPDQNS
jgi:hypothetical protein